MAGKTYERVLDGSRERIYQAGVQAVAELGYSVIEAKPEAGILSFNSGRSWKSWSGQDMTATILPLAGGKCRVVLGGATAMRGNPFGGGGQLVSWGEKGDVAEKFLAKVQQVLPGIPEPAPSGKGTMSAELENLARMHRDGLLSKAEFEVAKKKILGS